MFTLVCNHSNWLNCCYLYPRMGPLCLITLYLHQECFLQWSQTGQTKHLWSFYDNWRLPQVLLHVWKGRGRWRGIKLQHAFPRIDLEVDQPAPAHKILCQFSVFTVVFACDEVDDHRVFLELLQVTGGWVVEEEVCNLEGEEERSQRRPVPVLQTELSNTQSSHTGVGWDSSVQIMTNE